MCTVDYRRAWAHRRSAYAQLSPLSCDKLFQALSRFSVLEVMESWVGPGNKARIILYL